MSDAQTHQEESLHALLISSSQSVAGSKSNTGKAKMPKSMMPRYEFCRLLLLQLFTLLEMQFLKCIVSSTMRKN